jgi:protoporphyrin/coproporphyrin ferrochelatase
MSDPASCDAVLVIAFGGPESMDEVRPFLARVLAGRPVPPERLEEVVHHYELIGGRSPLNEITRRQAHALQAALASGGSTLPVAIGMRNSAPFIVDTLRELSARGCRRVLGVIMAAHESEASHGRYREAVLAAQRELGADAPEVHYSAGFHDHPGFIAANVAHTRAALLQLPEAERAGAPLLFTAHSIPTAIAERSPYVQQITRSAALVTAELGAGSPLIAYQSRSGSPRDPWLEPDVNAVIRAQAAQGVRALVLCPIGFVCDHVEVLYDLDVEAAQTARTAGVTLARAQAVNDHPEFIAALAARVREAAGGR